jgi:hypothetical protein
MTKKIFILEPSLHGHGGNFVRLLSQAFSEYEEIRIATYHNDFNYLFIQKYIDNSKIKPIYFLTDIMNRWKFPNAIEKYSFLLFIIVRFRPDIVMLPSIDGMIYLAFIFKPLMWLLGRKTKIYGFLASYKYYYSQIGWLKKFLFEVGIRCFDKILINDEFFAKHLQISGFDNVQYMPDPVEHFSLNTDKEQLKLKWNLPTDGYLVGMTGGINSRKGADIIINASSKMQRDDITFVLAGSVDDEIKNLLDKNTNTQLIIIDSFLDIQEMHEIITCLDLVLLPYRNVHFGIASILLRAIACNRPALVSNYGWLEKMSKNFEGIYSFTSQEDFMDKIQDIEKIILNNRQKIETECYTKDSIDNFLSAWI